jgi:hypothetical protein
MVSGAWSWPALGVCKYSVRIHVLHAMRKLGNKLKINCKSVIADVVEINSIAMLLA